MLIAFTLREDYTGTVEQIDERGESHEVPLYSGGLLHLGDDRDLDVRAELDAHDGHIVATDTAQTAVLALDAYLPLKRTTVPKGAVPIITPYDTMTLAAKRSQAAQRGITGASNASSASLSAALNAHDEALASGKTPTEPYTVAKLARAFGGTARDSSADDTGSSDDSSTSGDDATDTGENTGDAAGASETDQAAAEQGSASTGKVGR